MSILNVTPDSFSDGGENPVVDDEKLRELVRRHIAEGATIIDIGGQSSRQNGAIQAETEEGIVRISGTILVNGVCLWEREREQQ